MQYGRFTYGVEHIRTEWSQASVEIGSFTSIATGCTIILGGNHDPLRGTTFPFGYRDQKTFPCAPSGLPSTRGPVKIGNDVWIGSHVSIMSGVRIGDGAVVGAFSHVVSNVKPYAVVGGNPARLYYYRHPPEVVKRLRAMRWWDWPVPLIAEAAPLLNARDLDPLFAWWDRHKENT
jgi:acetyltransferase-like isoleucine patch superfamily enzyme